MKPLHYCSPVTSTSTDSNLSVLWAQRAYKIQENEENLAVFTQSGNIFQLRRQTATSKESFSFSLLETNGSEDLKVCYTSGLEPLPGQHSQSVSWTTSKREESVLKLKLCVPDVTAEQIQD